MPVVGRMCLWVCVLPCWETHLGTQYPSTQRFGKLMTQVREGCIGEQWGVKGNGRGGKGGIQGEHRSHTRSTKQNVWDADPEIPLTS